MDHWALRPHNSLSKFYCLPPRTERRILMSSGIPYAYHVLSSAGVSAFLTAQGMLLTLQHLERAFIKFLRLLPPTFYGVMAIQRWRFFTNSRARKLLLLCRFGYKYPFKSICPNYLCIQELLRHTLNLPIFLTHSCLFKSLSEDTFLILVSFSKLFKFSLLSFLCVFLPSPFFRLSLAFLSFS